MRVPALSILIATAVAGISPGAEPFRLFEVFATRIVEHEGGPAFQRGLLNATGEFASFEVVPFPPPGEVPAEAVGRFLMPAAIYFGYDVLGPEALDNFAFDVTPIMIGEQGYVTVSPGPEPKLNTGRLINISTRGWIEPGTEPLIGGFIVEARPRRVLIRGVGPGLAGLGVPAPLPDPAIAIFRHGEKDPFALNDDWGTHVDAEAIAEVTAAIGAFPLAVDSADAAHLVELPAGAYTVHLVGNDTAGGTALLEIYIVP